MDAKKFAVLIIMATFVFVSSCSIFQKRAASFQPQPDYAPLKKQFEKFIADRQDAYGIYFQDLGSGKSFGINEDKPMLAASTIKMPLSLYLSTLAAEKKLDWNTRVAYQQFTDYEGGSGVLRYIAREGDRYSLRVLNNLSLTISDNVAFRILARYAGRDNFVRFMKELGGKTVYPGGRNITTARDMGLYIQAVLDFARRHPEEGKRLLDDLSYSVYHVGLPGLLPESVVIAHKEGDLDEGVVNDAGVVFCSRPYILVVLSDGAKSLDEGFRNIARISRMAYDFQEKAIVR